MLQARGADPRLYNPDRDLLWAMPRLISTALRMIGKEVSGAQIREMMRRRCIETNLTDDELIEQLQSFEVDLAKFLGDLKNEADVREKPEPWFEKLFEDGDRGAVRAFIADLLVCAMFSEMPVWFLSVQPDKANSPLPEVEKVQKEVESILHGAFDVPGVTANE